MHTSHPDNQRAKSLLLAATFAFIATLIPVLAENAPSAEGIADATRAAEELGGYQKVSLLVYQKPDGSPQSAVFFAVGDYTFGYSADEGSHYIAARLGDSPQRLATLWCKKSVAWAEQIQFVPNKGGEQCPNGCLIDSLLHYYHLPQAQPDADWAGVFILLYGAEKLGGDHGVLVYERAGSSWVYDPCGCTTTFLGKIDIQHPRQIAQRLSPEATGGGWLVSRDLAWERRHGIASN